MLREVRQNTARASDDMIWRDAFKHKVLSYSLNDKVSVPIPKQDRLSMNNRRLRCQVVVWGNANAKG